jgi:hypothetical protein
MPTRTATAICGAAGRGARDRRVASLTANIIAPFAPAHAWRLILFDGPGSPTHGAKGKISPIRGWPRYGMGTATALQGRVPAFTVATTFRAPTSITDTSLDGPLAE